MKKYIIIPLLAVAIISCNSNKFKHDASGVFESTEIIVSAEASSRIELFNVEEGQTLQANQHVGYIDTTQLYLKKLQLQTAIRGTNVRKPDIAVQIASLKEQVAKAETEKSRIEKLFADNAATQKQVDDAASHLEVLRKSLQAQINSLSTSVNTLNEEEASYYIQIEQVEDLIKKSRIINPVAGTVLSKYVEEKEIVVQGKPLYKIADTENIFLRIYLVESQLSQVKLGQKITVFVSGSEGNQKEYEGVISWISEQAEFTPKTIQTKDERQNLVYAAKVAVKNTDGAIKIGMYGDADFK